MAFSIFHSRDAVVPGGGVMLWSRGTRGDAVVPRRRGMMLWSQGGMLWSRGGCCGPVFPALLLSPHSILCQGVGGVSNSQNSFPPTP